MYMVRRGEGDKQSVVGFHCGWVSLQQWLDTVNYCTACIRFFVHCVLQSENWRSISEEGSSRLYLNPSLQFSKWMSIGALPLLQ